MELGNRMSPYKIGMLILFRCGIVVAYVEFFA